MYIVRLFAFSVLLLWIHGGVITGKTYETNHEVAQIVFISCNRHDKEQSYWDLIASTVEHRDQIKSRNTSPDHTLGSCTAITPVDALVWLGDAVYADNFSFWKGSTPNTDIEIMRSKFVQQRNAPEYMAFRQTCVRRRDPSQLKYSNEEESCILGVWDDHDMGKNDGGAEYTGKDEVQQLFLDFLGVAGEDPRRKQQGVYNFEVIPFRSLEAQLGATRNKNNNNNNNNNANGKQSSITSLALEHLQRLYDAAVCVLLLDVRYFRDPANATRSGDMLGESQWRWLEQRLHKDVAGRNPQTGRERCAITVIGSGIQIIMDEKVSENWAAFPKSRDRLLMLLRKYRTERVLFVSGDVHLGEIGMDRMNSAIRTLGYPIIEATSSGLTHSSAKFLGLPTLINIIFPSTRRVGIYVERNYGVLQLTVNPEFEKLFSTGSSEIARDRLEEYINVSISIHSIPKNGKTVLYLTIPLKALTLDSGCQFLNANVDEFGRVIKSKVSMSQKCNEISEEVYNSESIKPQNYPSTEPIPLITGITQFIQRHVLPNYTLLQVVSTSIVTCVMVGIVVIIIIVICCCCCRNDSGKSKLA